MTTILFLTKDLMMQSSAAAAAKNANTKIKACGSVLRLRESLSAESYPAVFVDLQLPGLDLAELADVLNAMPSLKSIAFAQHVEEQLLANANLSAIDQVMTRGQFSTKLPSLIAEIIK